MKLLKTYGFDNNNTNSKLEGIITTLSNTIFEIIEIRFTWTISRVFDSVDLETIFIHNALSELEDV